MPMDQLAGLTVVPLAPVAAAAVGVGPFELGLVRLRGSVVALVGVEVAVAVVVVGVQVVVEAAG